MKKFKVTGGMGRLCQYEKTVTVEANDAEDAHWKAMGLIRQLITENDFKGNENSRFLTKIVNTCNIEEVL